MIQHPVHPPWVISSAAFVIIPFVARQIGAALRRSTDLAFFTLTEAMKRAPGGGLR
jgi:hypothetical protein